MDIPETVKVSVYNHSHPIVREDISKSELTRLLGNFSDSKPFFGLIKYMMMFRSGLISQQDSIIVPNIVIERFGERIFYTDLYTPIDEMYLACPEFPKTRFDAKPRLKGVHWWLIKQGEPV